MKYLTPKKNGRPKKKVGRVERNKLDKLCARQTLRWYVARGIIRRQPCEICGQPDAEGHHTDYSMPLRVRWLCRQHHMEFEALHNYPWYDYYSPY